MIEEGNIAHASTESDNTTQASTNTTENTGAAAEQVSDKDATGDSSTEEPALLEPTLGTGGVMSAVSRDRLRGTFMIDLGDCGIYHPLEADASHGIVAGELCAAMVVKLNKGDDTVNIHVHAPDSATVLFVPNVGIGAGPGLFHP